MIEAVNATAASAPLLRGNVEAVDAAQAYAANPERVQQSAPQAPYVSPYIAWNLDLNKAVLQIRDRNTGDVVREFPTEQAVRARQTAPAATEASVPAFETPEGSKFNSSTAQAQVAAAALAKSAQAGVPQISTVVTSA